MDRLEAPHPYHRLDRIVGSSCGAAAPVVVRKRVHLLLSGSVQGVFFRASTAHVARKLQLAGFVRNLPDGRVEVVAEGNEEALPKMVDWCRRGPPGAHVAHTDIDWEKPTGQFLDFQIR